MCENKKLIAQDEFERVLIKEILESFSLTDGQALAELEAPLIALRVWNSLIPHRTSEPSIPPRK